MMTSLRAFFALNRQGNQAKQFDKSHGSVCFKSRLRLLLQRKCQSQFEWACCDIALRVDVWGLLSCFDTCGGSQESLLDLCLILVGVNKHEGMRVRICFSCKEQRPLGHVNNFMELLCCTELC